MDRHGRFVWRELLADDVAGAKKFYSELAGWTYDEHEPDADGVYTHIKIGEHHIGGMMKRPEGVPVTMWAVYVSVDDVDARTHAAESAGGRIVYGPTGIGKGRRFSTILDPTGAAISFYKGVEAESEPYFGAGTFVWEQLVTNDIARAKDFYGKVLGWASSGEGVMATFGVGDGMMNQVASIAKAPAGVASHWVTHIAVKSLERAKETVHAHKGKIVVDKIEVPTIGAFSVINDPQGATVCVFEGTSTTPMPA